MRLSGDLGKQGSASGRDALSHIVLFNLPYDKMPAKVFVLGNLKKLI